MFHSIEADKGDKDFHIETCRLFYSLIHNNTDKCLLRRIHCHIDVVMKMMRIYWCTPSVLLEMCRVLNAFEINTDLMTIFRDQKCSFGPHIDNERLCEWIKVAKSAFKTLIKLSYSHHSR